MLAGMKNIELHVMENNADVSDGLVAGLLEVDDLDAPECAACAEEVGHKAGTFYPYAVALDETNLWMVCADCAGPVIDRALSIEEDAPDWASFCEDV
jgi:hypothetical protein